MSKLIKNDLTGIIKFAGRDSWRDHLEDCLDLHFGPVMEMADLGYDELLDILGPDWEGTLWGCAFEDLLTQEFEPGGFNIVDDYLKRRGWTEKAPTKAYIKALRHSVMSLYEVRDVVPGQSMTLHDLFCEGEPVTVSEKSATHTLADRDRIAARVITVNGRTIISGGMLPFRRKASKILIDAFNQLASEPDPGAGLPVIDDDTRSRQRARMFTSMWMFDFLEQDDLPELVNSDGEDVEFHGIVFPMAKGATQKAVIERLDAHPALLRADTKFWNWLASKGEERTDEDKPDAQKLATSLDDGSPLFGTVGIEGRKVRVEVNSAARAVRARTELTAHLGDLVGTPLTEIRSLEQLLAEMGESSEIDDDLVLPEGAVHEILDRQYAKILDEPLPVLGGKKPRELAQTEAGRLKVAEWIKYLEDISAKSGDASIAKYSFSWMWEELGISDLRD